MKKIAIAAAAAVISAASFFIYLQARKTPVPATILETPQSTETSTRPAAQTIPEPHPDSLPAIMAKDFQGDDLKLERILSENEAYTRYFITYGSEGLRISGIMNIPKGKGPFPVLILNHGYIDPVVYTNGQGLKREQDFFARNGYAVLHSDYRNHAQSDIDPENDTKPRSGYTEDVINAVLAVKNSELATLDKERIGMLGHSMGGGVTLNVMVTKPDLVGAYVLYAPINAEYRKNFDRWVATEMSEIARATMAKYGTFEENPEFWKTVSAINYLDRVSRPVLLFQGTADKDVPYEWSRDLSRQLQDKGKEITYEEYRGEPHQFAQAWPDFMQKSLKFFNSNLDPAE